MTNKTFYPLSAVLASLCKKRTTHLVSNDIDTKQRVGSSSVSSSSNLAPASASASAGETLQESLCEDLESKSPEAEKGSNCDKRPPSTCSNTSQYTPGQTIDLRTAENELVRNELKQFSLVAIQQYLSTSDFSLSKDLEGDASLRQSLADLFNSYFDPSREVSSSEIILGSGATSCLSALCSNICTPGDALLVPAPYWNVLDYVLPAQARVRLIPAVLNDMSCTRADDFIRALDAALAASTANVKAVLLTNPSNPLGKCLPRSLLECCLLFCQKHNLHLISDEVYALTARDMANEGASTVRFCSALSLDAAKLHCDPWRIHVVWSQSKDLGLSGMRLGCAVVQHNKALARDTAMTCGHTVSSLSVIEAKALLASSEFSRLLSLSRHRLAANYAMLIAFLEKLRIPYVPADAGVFVFVQLAKGIRAWSHERTMNRDLEAAGVHVSLGRSFHVHDRESGWVRICIAIDYDTLQEACGRIGKAIFVARSS